MIKLLVYLGAAVPVFLFVRSAFFRRAPKVKAAASDFNRHVGYLAVGVVILAGLVLTWSLGSWLFAR